MVTQYEMNMKNIFLLKDQIKTKVMTSQITCVLILWLASHSGAQRIHPPGMLAGDSGPVRAALALAGEPAGEGEGPLMPGRWGEVCGEKGDWAWLFCSLWLLDTPDAFTLGLRAPSAPIGKSSMEPDRS